MSEEPKATISAGYKSSEFYLACGAQISAFVIAMDGASDTAVVMAGITAVLATLKYIYTRWCLKSPAAILLALFLGLASPTYGQAPCPLCPCGKACDCGPHCQCLAKKTNTAFFGWRQAQEQRLQRIEDLLKQQQQAPNADVAAIQRQLGELQVAIAALKNMQPPASNQPQIHYHYYPGGGNSPAPAPQQQQPLPQGIPYLIPIPQAPPANPIPIPQSPPTNPIPIPNVPPSNPIPIPLVGPFHQIEIPQNGVDPIRLIPIPRTPPQPIPQPQAPIAPIPIPKSMPAPQQQQPAPFMPPAIGADPQGYQRLESAKSRPVVTVGYAPATVWRPTYIPAPQTVWRPR